MLHGNEVKTAGEQIPDLCFRMWPGVALLKHRRDLQYKYKYTSSTFVICVFSQHGGLNNSLEQ